jgi:hypothetical protein
MWQPRVSDGVHRPGAAVLLCLIFLFSPALFLGCISWNSADGTRHTLIVGLGLVSTKTAADQSATAFRCNTLGLAIQGGGAPGGLVLGYQSLQQTQIPPEWQGLVQVNSTPGQPLTVEGHGPPPPHAANAANPGTEERMP